MKLNAVLFKLVSKLKMSNKNKSNKAEFLSENAMFLKALNKDKRNFPKLNKNEQKI